MQYFAIGLLTLFTGLVELFLGLRFVFKLFGVSPANSLVRWVYDMSGVLLEPFRGIFPAKVLNNTYIFEFTTLFAMMVYAVLALLIATLIRALAPKSRPASNPDDELAVKKRRFW